MPVGRLVRASVPHLRGGDGGTIVTTTSRSVTETFGSFERSQSVLMSVIGLEETPSTELALEIRANAVVPGLHETTRSREIVERAVERGESESGDEELDARSDGMPLDRIGDPLELGVVVTIRSSPRSNSQRGRCADRRRRQSLEPLNPESEQPSIVTAPRDAVTCPNLHMRRGPALSHNR